MSRNLIVVDLETTGLGPQCAPIEVAAINVDTGQVLQFVPHVDLSKVSIEPQAFAINRYFDRGVYQKMLSPAETASMWCKVSAMLRDNTFAGSNPAFDARLVAGELTVQPTWHHRLADLAAYAAPALGRDPSELPGLADVLAALKYIDATPVREHLLKLQAIGWSVNAVATANGSPGKLAQRLRQILRGQQTCAQSTRDYVMWLDPELPPESGNPFVRKWSEYQFIGVPDHEAARRMGITYESMREQLIRNGFPRSALLLELAREE
ncbi:hypothetical protein ADUPG1_002095, partial [Aduncisulcus paluster]